MKDSKDECSIYAEKDPVLGNFIEGYDSRREFNPRNGCILILGVIVIIIGVFALVTAISNGQIVGGILSFMIFGGIGCIPFYIVLRSWRKPNRVMVYEKGFIWKVLNRKGEEMSSKQVMFGDVTSIHYSKVFYNRGSGILDVNTGTYLDFKVFAQKDEILIHKKGNNRCSSQNPDEGGWMYYSMDAIEAQWTKFELPRMRKEWEEKGELSFVGSDGFIVTLNKEGIKAGTSFVPWENMKYQPTCDRCLKIDNALNKKNFFSSPDIKINLNTLSNSLLFLEFFLSLVQQAQPTSEPPQP